ncbi:MAG: hypothetical protein IT374_15910 [Polyangiaceae bacterium]|nr:hypothetical protein [Polyangiaceae bacterium]
MSTAVVHERFLTLVAQARRLHRKGERKKELTALRQACLLEEDCASAWTLYAARLADAGRREDAAQAFRHAIWLRHRDGDLARERATVTVAARRGVPLAA